MIRKLCHTRLITPQFLSFMPQLDRNLSLTLALVLDDERQRRAMLAMPDEQLVVHRPKRAQRGDESRRLEQIRFSLPVGTEQEMLAAGKFERSKAHVAKMPQGELAQAHGVGE